MGCGFSSTATSAGASGDIDSFDYDKQLLSDVTRQFSVIVNPNDTPVGETHIRRNPMSVDGLAAVVYPEEPHPVSTLWDGFQRGVRMSADRHCLGMRSYKLTADSQYVNGGDGTPERGDFVWQSYRDVDAESKLVGSALISLGMTSHQHVGIYSKNRPEWTMTALGLWSQSLVIVALYDTLGHDAVEYIIKHADIKIIFVTKENIPALLPILPSLNQLTHIIQYDYRPQWNNIDERVNPETVTTLQSHGIQLLSYSQLLEVGAKASTVFPNPAKPDDRAYTMYTSGTTGNPKGAILGHLTLCSSIQASRNLLTVTSTDVHLSYLPLAHIFECGVMCLALFSGASIGFSTGLIKKLTEDIQTLRPTKLFGVPRVFQRIYTGLFAKVDQGGGIKARLFHSTFESEVRRLRSGQKVGQSFLSRMLFHKVRQAAGLDRVTSIITGAAPCPAYIIVFLKVVFQCDVIQGYGMTETCCVIAGTDPSDNNVGHVGAPLPCNEMKLVDIEEMGYLSTDQPYARGEIWVRGPNIFKGYYKDEENTAAALKGDGWLATGDVGRWNPNGTLSIIDRRKNLFKLAQGEYVAAENIEALLLKSPLVGQVWVYGNSFKSFLVGVVVPNGDWWQRYAIEHGWWPSDSVDIKTGDDRWPAIFNRVLIEHSAEVRSMLVQSLTDHSKNLKGFERIKDWIFEFDLDKDGFAFNTDNGLMTPTFKVRRHQLLQKYTGQLRALYATNGEADKSGERWPGL